MTWTNIGMQQVTAVFLFQTMTRSAQTVITGPGIPIVVCEIYHPHVQGGRIGRGTRIAVLRHARLAARRGRSGPMMSAAVALSTAVVVVGTTGLSIAIAAFARRDRAALDIAGRIGEKNAFAFETPAAVRLGKDGPCDAVVA